MILILSKKAIKVCEFMILAISLRATYKKHNMRKINLPLALCTLITLLSVFGCTEKPKPEIDESGYIGTYYGKHYLADSVSLRTIVGNENMIYDDTLVVTNGASATDGKVNAKSSLLGGQTIELDVSTGAITPVYIGNITILSTTLKDSKFNTGSTASWNSDKSVVTTHLTATVTYVLGSTDIPITPVNINGSFTKH